MMEKISTFLQNNVNLKFFLPLLYQFFLVPDFKALLNYCPTHMSNKEHNKTLPFLSFLISCFRLYVFNLYFLLSSFPFLFLFFLSSSPCSFLPFLLFILSSLSRFYPHFFLFSSLKTNKVPAKLLCGFMHFLHLCIRVILRDSENSGNALSNFPMSLLAVYYCRSSLHASNFAYILNEFLYILSLYPRLS